MFWNEDEERRDMKKADGNDWDQIWIRIRFGFSVLFSTVEVKKVVSTPVNRQ